MSTNARKKRINTTGEYTCSLCNGSGHTAKTAPETIDHGRKRDDPKSPRYTVSKLGSGCPKCLGRGIQKDVNKYYEVPVVADVAAEELT